MIRLELADRHDGELLVGALLETAAVRERTGRQTTAARLRRLADALGDALDAGVPVPSGYGAEPAAPLDPALRALAAVELELVRRRRAAAALS